jgi:hypothetical protein
MRKYNIAAYFHVMLLDPQETSQRVNNTFPGKEDERVRNLELLFFVLL